MCLSFIVKVSGLTVRVVQLRHSKEMNQMNSDGKEEAGTGLINVMDSFVVYHSYSIYVDV